MLITIFMFTSCKETGKDESKPVDRVVAAASDLEEIREVEIIVLKRSGFRRDITSNGKLTALRKSDLEFRVRERVTIVNVRNGDQVMKGDVIAILDTFALYNALLISRSQHERALLEFQDYLLMQGYGAADTSGIPQQAIKAARIRSGLDRAEADLKQAGFNLREATLRAPFDGVVANLFDCENSMSVPGTTFCSIIDDSRFMAYFPVLESELSRIRKGQSVSIIPFVTGENESTGVIASVNPVVDNNGMIRLGAVTSNNRKRLYEGMNVKVIAGEIIPNQIVIPRQSVVLRSDRKVVFTLANGRAQWVYITTGLENLDSFIVTDGLKEGDTLIVRGNFNLNHDTKVIVR